MVDFLFLGFLPVASRLHLIDYSRVGCLHVRLSGGRQGFDRP